MQKRWEHGGRLTLMVSALYLLMMGVVTGQTDSTLYRLGKALYELNEKKIYEKTVDVMNAYLIGYPEGEKAAEVQLSLANLHNDSKKRDRAFVSYLKTVMLYPGSPQVTEAKEKANEAISKDVKLTPIKEKLVSLLGLKVEDTELSNRYFRLLQELRDLIYPKLNEAVIPECQVFVETYPDHPNAPLVAEWIGDMYRENKKHWEALTGYLRVVHLYAGSDRDLSCRLKMGDLYSNRLKRFEDAVRTYESILRSEADSLLKSESQWKLARVLHEKMMNHAWAAKEYQSLVDQFPNNPHCLEALMNRAELQVSKLKQLEGGIATYRQVVERFPEHADAAQALISAGEVYEKKMKDYENAIQTYQEVSEKYPSSSHSAETLFKAAELAEKKLKDINRAMGLYQQVVDKFSEEKIAGKALQQIESLKKQTEGE